MKTRILLISAVAALLGATSCEDYLDKNIVTTQNEEFTFASYQNAVQVAYSVYADLPDGFSEIY